MLLTIRRDRISARGLGKTERLRLEVAAGLEPAKIGFADRRLGLFGIATKIVPKSIPKVIPKLPPERLFTPNLVPVTY